MTNFHEILSSEVLKEISEIRSNVSANELFLEKLERNLTRETGPEKSRPVNFPTINQGKSRRTFSCPSCNFLSDEIRRVAQHIMRHHEKKFPYSKGSIINIIISR